MAVTAGFEAYPILWGGCLQDLAAVLAEAGSHDEAREVLIAAARTYHEKGALGLASQVRRELAWLDRSEQAADPD